MELAFGLFIVVFAILAITRQVDVRLALSLAALALGLVAGDPQLIVRTFLATFSNEQFVVPICSAMGFAYVLRHTGCDQHLVQLLTGPIRRVRPILIPGAVLVGFLVNIPIISQTSTAVAVGAVLLPLLRTAGVSAATAGAALLLGASLGGELLNPGAPEFQTIKSVLHLDDTRESVRRIVPFLALHLTVATLVFWWMSRSTEANLARKAKDQEPEQEAPAEPELRVHLAKAFVPLLPLALLFVTGPPFHWFEVRSDWLVASPDQPGKSTRLIGLAMLVGVVAAAVANRSTAGIARSFFEGAGYAFANIISLIVCATAFGKGVEAIGLAQLLGQALQWMPGAFLPLAALLPLGFAVVSGSGFAATQSLFETIATPGVGLGFSGIDIGSVVAMGAAAGRTMSPVAAVTLMCGAMTDTSPATLARRVAPPLLAGLATVVVAQMVLGG